MVIKLPERITIKQPLQETAHAAEAAGRSLVSFPEEAARGASTARERGGWSHLSGFTHMV